MDCQNQRFDPILTILMLRLGTVPTKAPNPNNENKKSATGVWIHPGGKNRTGSEGCLTIDPRYWDAFIKNFPKGSKGKLKIW